MTRQSRANTSRFSMGMPSFIYALTLCLVMLGGCGARVSSHGHMINENELKKIDLGKTTKAEILQIFGRPSFDGAFDKKRLHYSSQVMLQPVAGVKMTQKRIIYIFKLDNDNVLQSIELIDEEDGLTIALVDDKTPTPGDTFGVIEQVFSNIKRQKPKE